MQRIAVLDVRTCDSDNPLGAAVSGREPMRTVYATTLDFPGASPTKTAFEVWSQLGGWVADWYSRRAVKLNIDWRASGPQEFTPADGHLIRITQATLDDGDEPVVRDLLWRYPDAYDSSLLWQIESSVFVSEEAAHFTLLLRIVGSSFEIVPVRFSLGTPRVVRHLLRRDDAHVGGFRLTSSPVSVGTGDDLGKLVGLLCSSSRRFPVLVVSPDPYRETPVIDTDGLASSVAGLGMVAVLNSKWVGFELTDHLGKHFSCYNGAVRIYWPGFSVHDNPLHHPLYLPARIAALGGSKGFANHVLKLVAAVSSFRWVEPPTLRKLRQRIRDAEIKCLLESTKKDKDYDEVCELWLQADEERKRLQERVDELEIENENLKANLHAVWQLGGQEEAQDEEPLLEADDDEPEPQSVSEAVQLAKKRVEHVEFLDEAFESAEESPFQQPSRVFHALLAIDEVARAWAISLDSGESWGGFRRAFSERGFEYKHKISQTTRGKWGEEYTYNYRGKRVAFEPHITLGAKQPDKCLSIHMHWDEERRRAIVAHVGRHKRNTKT